MNVTKQTVPCFILQRVTTQGDFYDKKRPGKAIGWTLLGGFRVHLSLSWNTA